MPDPDLHVALDAFLSSCDVHRHFDESWFTVKYTFVKNPKISSFTSYRFDFPWQRLVSMPGVVRCKLMARTQVSLMAVV